MIKKSNNILNDNSVYIEIKNDATTWIENKSNTLVKLLREKNNIDKHEYRHSLTKDNTIIHHQSFILHKKCTSPNTFLSPIVSTINSPLTSLSVFIMLLLETQKEGNHV